MAPRNVLTVKVEGEGDFGQAKREAVRAAGDIEESFDKAADGVEKSFDGAGDGVKRSLSEAERAADRAADGIGDSFDDVASDVERSFDGVGDGVKRSLADAERAADRAADDIGDSFDKAAKDTKKSFDGAGAKIGADLSKAPKAANRIAKQMPPPFERAANDIGESFESALNGIGDNIDLSSAAASVTSQLGSLAALGGPVGAVAGLIGTQFGDDLAEGFQSGFSSRKRGLVSSIRSGLEGAELASVGRAGGAAYSKGFGEGLADVTRTASILKTELQGLDRSIDLTQSTKQAQVLADVFEVDLASGVELARRLISNDLVDDTDEAFNLMAQTAQKFQINFEDIFDVASEFSPVFNKLGVDGAQAFDIIGQTVQQGLLPNVDRAGELFEEFNIRLSELGTLDEPIAAIGLSIGDMQAKLANGQGAEALAEISEALLAIEDPAKRNSLAIDIFGASIESASDPDAVLRLLATADAVGEIGTAASDAVADLEAMQSGMDKLSKSVETGGRFLGEQADAWVFSRLTMIEYGASLIGVTDSLEEQRAKVSEAANEVNLYTNRADAMRSINAEVASSFDGTAGAVEGVRASIEGLFNFNFDQSMREIAGATDALADSLASTDSAAVGLNGAIDITTEGGGQLQRAFENLAVQQQRNIEAFNDGKLTADEFSTANAGVESSLREVLSQSDLTAAQVQGLIDKYLATPDQVETLVTLDDRASGRADEIRRAIDRIKGKTVTIRTNYVSGRGSSRASSGGFQEFARGGLARGPSLVGEEGFELAKRSGKLGLVGLGGPEVRDFKKPTQIYPHEETVKLLMGQLPGFANGTKSRDRMTLPAPPPATRQLAENIQIYTQPGRDLAAELDLALRMEFA